MYTFFDDPELMHQINQDLCNYHIRVLHKISKVCRPTFLTFAEDMSYNHGPMLSRELFGQFLAPYYKRVVPVIQELGIIPIIDTDGDIVLVQPELEKILLHLAPCLAFGEEVF